ncbi:MAG: hypothetical protein LBF72_01915 [Holosporales bacterium]|jgi:hypothetical protein|nr:hypothetical protein [Holosporales bacterium]
MLRNFLITSTFCSFAALTCSATASVQAEEPDHQDASCSTQNENASIITRAKNVMQEAVSCLPSLRKISDKLSGIFDVANIEVAAVHWAAITYLAKMSLPVNSLSSLIASSVLPAFLRDVGKVHYDEKARQEFMELYDSPASADVMAEGIGVGEQANHNGSFLQRTIDSIKANKYWPAMYQAGKRTMGVTLGFKVLSAMLPEWMAFGVTLFAANLHYVICYFTDYADDMFDFVGPLPNSRTALLDLLDQANAQDGFNVPEGKNIFGILENQGDLSDQENIETVDY